MINFWVKFNELFGDRPAQLWGDEVPDAWVSALAGISGERIAMGLQRAFAGEHEPDLERRKQGWPPNLAAFRALCELAPVGLADTDTAWGEALQVARGWKQPHELSHPVIWHALSQIGSFRGIDEDVLESRFRKNYSRACANVAAGKTFEPIPQPLPPPSAVRPLVDTPECVAAREEALAKLDRMFPRSRSEVATDAGQ